MTGPVGIVIVAIAAIVAAFVLLSKVRLVPQLLDRGLGRGQGRLRGRVAGHRKVLGWIVEGFTINFRIIKAAVKWFWDSARPFFITEGIKTWWRIISRSCHG